jgi:hypothetical protein
VNISRVSLDRIEANLIALGKVHPFKIQSFFCSVLPGANPSPPAPLPPAFAGAGSGEGRNAVGWDDAEVAAWLARLARIRASGARILEVQLYTLARRPAESFVQPVDAVFLDSMRQCVEALGIPAKVYGAGE